MSVRDYWERIDLNLEQLPIFLGLRGWDRGNVERFIVSLLDLSEIRGCTAKDVWLTVTVRLPEEKRDPRRRCFLCG